MKKILLIVMLLSLNLANGASSMRNCILLPITDMGDGKVSFSIFEQIEDFLKSSEWCEYKSNSEIIDILGNYKRNISTHLKNPEVLKLISQKTNSGSLIYIELINKVKGYQAKMTVIGANGDDVYYLQQEDFSYLDASNISSTIENWLMEYEKNIPYDGRIIGILGNQFTVDFGKDYGLKIGDTIKVKRPIRKKKHPLLKEVIDWESKVIARASVFSVTNEQAQCRIEEYNSRSKIKLEDWAIMKENDKDYEPNNPGDDKYKFGKLGQIGIFGNITKGSSTINGNDTTKLGGYLMGVSSKVELWATRNWWGSLSIRKDFGSYSKDKGNAPSSTTIDTTHYKLVGGYKYLPLGYFFGPQIDLYAGYGSYRYGMSTTKSAGITEVNFYGLLVGVKVDIPVYAKYRGFINLDIMPYGGYEEEVSLNGSDKSTYSYEFEIGSTYVLNPRTSLYGSLDIVSNKTTFKSSPNGTSSLTMNDTALKFGGVFTF